MNRYRQFEQFIKRYDFVIHPVKGRTDICSVTYRNRGPHLFTIPARVITDFGDNYDNNGLRHPNYKELTMRATTWANKIADGWLKEYEQSERDQKWIIDKD